MGDCGWMAMGLLFQDRVSPAMSSKGQRGRDWKGFPDQRVRCPKGHLGTLSHEERLKIMSRCRGWGKRRTEVSTGARS